MRIFVVALIVSSLVTVTAGQAKDRHGDYELRGTLQNDENQRIPGLRLHFSDGENITWTVSDHNGRFSLGLSNGNYVLTTPDIPGSKFRAFLRIDDSRMNPQEVAFTLATGTYCSERADGSKLPIILQSAVPTYPAVARAVRAVGLVKVEITIATSGIVSASKAVTGHPLLRKAAEIAAQKFLFEASAQMRERKAPISFYFAHSSDETTGSVERFKCDYLIVIPAAPVAVIDTVEHGG